MAEDFGYGALTPYGRPFQNRSPILLKSLCFAALQPRTDEPHGLGSSRFARRY